MSGRQEGDMGSKKEEIVKEVRADVERLHKLAENIAELDKSAGVLFEELEKDANKVSVATLFFLACILRGAMEECEGFIKHCRER
jgi:hypothetical protein